MRNASLVSVIVPVFNGERWVEATLQSALDQTWHDLEVIVIDDGSLDGTRERLASIASRDPRMRVIHQRNAGVGAARNRGILQARGGYIAPLDADDLWHPRKLEHQVARLEERGERAGMAYCWTRRVDAAGRELGRHQPFRIEGDALRALILKNFVGNASVPLFRREALDDVGLYLTRAEQGGVQGCEDWDLSIRVAARWEVAVVPEVLVDYRQVDHSMSSGAARMVASFHILMDRARARHPELPAGLFRHAESHFQNYIMSKSYPCGEFAACLRAAVTAVKLDPGLLLSSRFRSMTAKSALRFATGGWPRPRTAGSQPVPGTGRPPRGLLDRIHARRWQRR